MVQQAWSFKTIRQDELRYWGNDGYHDDSSTFYRYDSFVANHKNVKAGDIVIITSRDKVLGISIVKTVSAKNINKKRNKCIHLDCNAKKILHRKTIKPEWRCDNGHEFIEPRVIYEPAIEFVANYGESYKEIENVSMDELMHQTPRYNGQMSIQEVNLAWAMGMLNYHSNMVISIESRAADENTPILSAEDQRKIVERQIKQRRGQQKFRNQLLDLNPVCAVTECSLVDILEAAHIEAYRNDSHNHISNGLLLRSDIHTLFDLNLCAINPDTKCIHFSQGPLEHGYQQFEGSSINVTHKISLEALKKRWGEFSKLFNHVEC
ncbi:TPA: HNH endonuclease [Klebsiella oxytoca]